MNDNKNPDGYERLLKIGAILSTLVGFAICALSLAFLLAWMMR